MDGLYTELIADKACAKNTKVAMLMAAAAESINTRAE